MLRKLMNRQGEDGGQDETEEQVPAEATGLPRLLDVKEVAEALGLAEWRIYELVAADRIPCVRIERRIKFHPVAVNEWLLAGGTAPKPEDDA